MADWTKPATTSTKTGFPTEIIAIATSAAKLDYSSDTNVPTNVIRYNRTSKQVEQYNGSTWDAQELTNLKDGAVSATAKIADDIVSTAKLQAAAVTKAKIEAAMQPPVGGIIAFGAAAAPTGWLLCNGAAVSRSTYSDLFGVIGTTYGAGDGSTTFNVPDLRQRFPLGKAASGTGSTLGGTGGNIDHTHTGPSHTHDMGNHTHTGPSHTHGPSGLRAAIGSNPGTNEFIFMDLDGANTFVCDYKYTGGSAGLTAYSNTIASVPIFGATDAGGTGNTGAPSTNTTSASGTGATGSGNPPFQTVNYIIKI